MANIPILSIQPQAGTGVTPSQVVTQGAGSQGQVVLPNLPPGSILSGFIVNRDLAGNPILRTESSDVTFATPFFLRIGSEVVLRLENRAGTLTANLLSVDGQPPEVAENQSGFTQTQDVVVSPNTQTQGAQTPATQTVTVQATPEPANNAPAPAPIISGTLIAPALPTPGTQSLPAGTELRFQLLSVNTPPDAILPEAVSPAASAGANPALYAAYQRGTTPTPSAAAAAPALPQAEAAVTAPSTTPANPPPISTAITSNPVPAQTPALPQTVAAPVSPPPSSIPAAPEPAAAAASTPAPIPALATTGAAAPTVIATVIGHASTGAALAQTPYGIVEMEPDISLPQGSTLVLAVTQTTPPQTTPAATAEANTLQAPLLDLARQWTSLQQLIQVLVDTPPPGAPQATLPALVANVAAPQTQWAPEDISAGLMMFMAALRGNDFTNWLGKENVSWLESQGLSGMVRKAEGEFNLLARQYGDTPTQSWKTLFFPLAAGGEWQQVRLFVKRDRKQQSGGQGKKGEGTRFVVEMDLSQLGPMQMDGLVHKYEKNMQFDLFIRSQTALPANVQQDIFTIYTNIGELTGYKGNLLFQAVKEFPVNPMEEVMAQIQGSVMA